MTPAETPPNPLPSVLHDTGCCFCGSLRWGKDDPNLFVLGSPYNNAKAAFCCACFAAHGSNNDTIDAEITRRKSLASSPPSPAEGEAFKVGDEVAGVFVGHGGCVVNGPECVGVFKGWAEHNGKRVAHIRCKCGEPWVHESSLRIIRRATPPEGKSRSCCPGGEAGYACGCGQKVAAPSHRPDPYTTRPHGMNEEQVAAAMAELSPFVMPPKPRQPNAHDLRVAAMKETHVADLDRSTRERLVALGGRHGKRVALVNRNWPEAEED